MKKTVTENEYVSVGEIEEFLDRMEETGRGCKDEFIGGAVLAVTGAMRKLIGMAKRESIEPVIRCGECKYRNEYCYLMRSDDWYCGDGVKKDE